MKKIFLFIIIPILLLACTDDMPETISSTEITNKSKGKAQRVGGDGKFDLLGYGYDATGSHFDPFNAKAPVIDINKFNNVHPTRIIENFSPGVNEGVFQCGVDAEKYSNKLTVRANAGVNWGLFTGEIKGMYNTTSIIDTKHSFASYEKLIKRKKITFNASTQLLSNFLTEDFKNDLIHESPDYIITNYGTHVLCDIELGGKLKIHYRSVIESGNKEKAVEAGLSTRVGKFFNLSVNLESNATLANNNKEEFIVYKTIGGDPTCSLIGSFSAETSNTTINTTNWESSVTMSNISLINVEPGKLIPIYEFVNNPAKKQQIKEAFLQYVSGNSFVTITKLVFNLYNGHTPYLANERICNCYNESLGYVYPCYSNANIYPEFSLVYLKEFKAKNRAPRYSIEDNINEPGFYFNKNLCRVYKPILDSSGNIVESPHPNLIPIYSFKTNIGQVFYTKKNIPSQGTKIVFYVLKDKIY